MEQIKGRLAKPPSSRSRAGSAVAFAERLGAEIVAARSAGKSWAQIIDDCGEAATFTSDALRQACALNKKRIRKTRKTTRPVVTPAVNAKRSITAGRASADQQERDLFADAFSARVDTLSDIKE